MCGRVASNFAAALDGVGYAGNRFWQATPVSNPATGATSCSAASSRDRPWLGNTGLPGATGCAVRDHGTAPDPEPAHRPARPRGCAQSAKWVWICGSGSSSVAVPCSNNAPALPAEESPVCWIRITGNWPWTFRRFRGIPQGWLVRVMQPVSQSLHAGVPSYGSRNRAPEGARPRGMLGTQSGR